MPLVLEMGGETGSEVWAVGMQPRWQGKWVGKGSMRSLTLGARRIGASRVFVVHGGTERKRLRNGAEVVGIKEMMGRVGRRLAEVS